MYEGKNAEEDPEIGCTRNQCDDGVRDVSPLSTGYEGGVGVDVHGVGDEAKGMEGAHRNIEHSHGIEAAEHEVDKVDAPTVGGTTVGVRDEVGGVDREVRISGGYNEGQNGGSVRQSPCGQCVAKDDDVVGTVDVAAVVEKCLVSEDHGMLPPDEGGQTFKHTTSNLCCEEVLGAHVLRHEMAGIYYCASDEGQKLQMMPRKGAYMSAEDKRVFEVGCKVLV